jgi:4-oxalocrotonate tautomerase
VPLIDVSILDGRLTPETAERLIARLTDAVADVFDDSVREHTWVVLRPVPPARWGIAGKDCS